MAEDTPDEDQKTEIEPTARRLQKAREDGQAPRSQELGIAQVMISSMAFLYLSGGWLIGHLSHLVCGWFCYRASRYFLSLCRIIAFSGYRSRWFFTFYSIASNDFCDRDPVFISDGWLELVLEGNSPESQQVESLKWTKRMFGLRSLVELVKSVLKFSLVAAVLLAYMVYDFSDELTVLSAMNFEPAMEAVGIWWD